MNFIAPYWRHYDHGTISVMEYNKNAVLQLSSSILQFPIKFLPDIAKDLNEAFGTGERLNRVTVKQRDNLTTDRIERVIAFTWFDMYSDAETGGLGRVSLLIRFCQYVCTEFRHFSPTKFSPIRYNNSVHSFCCSVTVTVTVFLAVFDRNFTNF